MTRNNLQDFILNQIRREKMLATIYLTNGVPIKGRVISFDNFTIVLEYEQRQTLVYKHAVTTIQPERPIRLHTPEQETPEE
ncbi:MAG: RNA chaperone Hfq [Turneriella sp.]|nr:RNA chaperone Hfq [Leptospiraceae bacterium]MCX7632346.1 RNA chaperone Hfq [Turneriella sp.]